MKKENVEVGSVYSVKVSNQTVAVRLDSLHPAGGWEATNLATSRKIHIKTAGRLRGPVGPTPAADGGRESAGPIDIVEVIEVAEAKRRAGVTHTIEILPKARTDGYKQARTACRIANKTDGAFVIKEDGAFFPAALVPKREEATVANTAATDAKGRTKATTGAKPAPGSTRAKGGGDTANGRIGVLDAAAKVLAKAKEPMACKDIVEVAIAKGWWSTSGKTPGATLHAAMTREISKKGKESRFEKVERGRFSARGAK